MQNKNAEASKTEIAVIQMENRDLQEAFLEMEEAAHRALTLRVDNPEVRRDIRECIDAFAQKYRSLIQSVQSVPPYGTEIRLKRLEAPSFREYDKIRDEYSGAYYLEDCGGFLEFRVSHGRKLESRLRDMLSLIHPSENDIILDVGCGRGELSYALAEKARRVLGVDYSSDAIGIAEHIFGWVRENLSFVCGDILELPHREQYTKIVMSDVYEHIEMRAMERLLSGLAGLLAPGGRVFVHTAPNLDYYAEVYAEEVRKRAAEGGFLPENPRSRYEDRMHINEQTPRRLRDTLRRHFGCAFAWTGHIEDEAQLEDFARQRTAIDITAVAGANLSVGEVYEMLSYKRQYAKKMERGEARAKITGSLSAVCHAGDASLLHPVRLSNEGAALWISEGPFPVYLSYHVYDMDGALLVYDGIRTSLDYPLAPGETAEESVMIDISQWKEGSYVVHITLVQEGVLWFDDISEENVLRVLVECRATPER